MILSFGHTMRGGVLSGVNNVFSARSFRDLYGTGYNVARVRRNSDQIEADFTATEWTDGTLAAWVGASNDGYLVKQYDPSGNGNDWTQAASSAQAQVVENGVVLTKGGYYGLRNPAKAWIENETTTGLPSNASVILSGYWEALAGYDSQRFLAYDSASGTNFLMQGRNGFGTSWHSGAGSPSVRLNGVDKTWNLNSCYDDIATAGLFVARVDGVDFSGWDGITSRHNGGALDGIAWIFEEVILDSSSNAAAVESAMSTYLGL